MQTANVMLALGGKKQSTVPKRGVTPAEVLMLIAIHGRDAVYDIYPRDEEDDSDLDDFEELERIRTIYGSAEDANGDRISDKLFPGNGARVPQTFDELRLPTALYKATERAAPAPRGGKKADAPAQAPASVPATPATDAPSPIPKGTAKTPKAKAARKAAQTGGAVDAPINPTEDADDGIDQSGGLYDGEGEPEHNERFTEEQKQLDPNTPATDAPGNPAPKSILD